MMPVARRIAVLGSTGSIGRSALEVAAHLKGEVKLVALAAGKNYRLLWKQILQTRPEAVALSGSKQALWLKNKIKTLKGKKPVVFFGSRGLEEIAGWKSAQMLLTSIVGSAGLIPTLKAIEKGKDIALANKETLVAAGELVSREAVRRKVKILPVDSEHNALFQCLKGIEKKQEVKRLILTASGGPFKDLKATELKKVTVSQALKHPTWSMGKKITIDSATLMNKGLEVIEARWLFNMDFKKIDVVIHPQSVIHSMVETVDGSILAQLGPTDMRLPIQYAFTWPRRLKASMRPLDFLALGSLTFQKPDFKKFPCLELAYWAGEKGGLAPAVLNAANEIAVEAFLSEKISFMDIPVVLRKVLMKFIKVFSGKFDLESIIYADKWARKEVIEFISNQRSLK
jgi:1-deoxy-D-xylulose-5-phosphate reductoisomerase